MPDSFAVSTKFIITTIKSRYFNSQLFLHNDCVVWLFDAQWIQIFQWVERYLLVSIYVMHYPCKCRTTSLVNDETLGCKYFAVIGQCSVNVCVTYPLGWTRPGIHCLRYKRMSTGFVPCCRTNLYIRCKARDNESVAKRLYIIILWSFQQVVHVQILPPWLTIGQALISVRQKSLEC